MANNETIPEREEAMVSMAEAAVAKQHEYIHGDDQKDVVTESGQVPSLAKQARLGVEKISAVLEEAAVQGGGALPYPSIEIGLINTPYGGLFTVPSDNDLEYLVLYRNDSGVATPIDISSNSRATTDALGRSEAAYALALPKSMDKNIPWAIVDQFLRVILGVKANGTVHAILDQLPGLDLIGEYAWAITDASGVVLLGIKWSGEVVMYGQSTVSVTAFADGPIGAQDVWVLVDGAPYQITSSGDNFSPMVGSGRLTYLTRNGAVAQKTMDLPVAGSMASFVTVLLHILSSGQSLSVGVGSALTTLLPPTANRLFTLNDGLRLSAQDGTLAPEMVAPFKPMISKLAEVPCVQTAAQINRIRGLPSNAGLLTSAHGRSGYSLAQLSKGTVYFNNMITAVIAAKAEAVRLGLGYRVPFVDWIQGESDRAKAAGEYTAALLQLQSDFDTDIRAASGQSQVVPILLDQISNWTAYNIATSWVPLEQLQVALDYPDRFYCAGPKYWLKTNPDGIHLPGPESMQLGAMHARAAEAVIKGITWQPTHAISAVISGSVVTVKFHTPSGPLVVDTVGVTDPGNWGVRFVDDTNSASVQSVKLVGNNTLKVTLSAPPTGANPYIGIADIGIGGAAGGPTTGPRSCLRDNSQDFDGYGQPVFNWACHQRLGVTSA